MGTYTNDNNLYKPSVGEQGWGSLVNNNFDKIDKKITNTNITNVVIDAGVVDRDAVYFNGIKWVKCGINPQYVDGYWDAINESIVISGYLNGFTDLIVGNIYYGSIAISSTEMLINARRNFNTNINDENVTLETQSNLSVSGNVDILKELTVYNMPDMVSYYTLSSGNILFCPSVSMETYSSTFVYSDTVAINTNCKIYGIIKPTKVTIFLYAKAGQYSSCANVIQTLDENFNVLYTSDEYISVNEAGSSNTWRIHLDITPNVKYFRVGIRHIGNTGFGMSIVTLNNQYIQW